MSASASNPESGKDSGAASTPQALLPRTAAGRYRALLNLAWPVFIGQMAVMAYGVIDTIMAGQLSATEVAAIGLGASVYITIYVATMGVLLALIPVVAQNFGAGRLERIGVDFVQGLWLALFLAIPGCLALTQAGFWLELSAPPPEVAERTRFYLWAVAAGLPAALLFRVFYALNNALARPKMVMLINLAGLLFKIPLNLLFMYGFDPGAGLPAIPALGGAGCGLATSLIAWGTLAAAIGWTRRDPWYRQFQLFAHLRPDGRVLRELLRLGIPIGAGYLVEITSFTAMAVLVARFGATVGASHAIASNLTGVLYMAALGLSVATGVLTAQALGAAEPRTARRIVGAGALLVIVVAFVLALGLWLGAPAIARVYSADADVIRAVIPLLGLVAIFHFLDAAQTLLINVLRAHKIALLPTVVYVVSLWGIGLGGGWWLTFNPDPPAFLARFQGEVGGALGFWVAGAVSLVVATAGLALILIRTWRDQPAPPGSPPTTAGLTQA